MTSRYNPKPSGPSFYPLIPSRRFFKETGFFLLDILYNAVLIIALVILIRSFLISPFRVIGSSMADTLASNEFILIDKLSYRLGVPHRGDPVVFRPPITNKYSAKFEGELLTDGTGMAFLDLKPIRHSKPVIYCQNAWMDDFWFCQDKVKTGDLAFALPKDQLEQEGELAWTKANERKITREEMEAGTFTLAADRAAVSYTVRIYDSDGPEYFVKRIIGIPGDTLKIENGRVYLKKSDQEHFELLEETYLNEENRNHTYLGPNARSNEFLVPEGQYFVLGDNRNHSNDSRSWFAPLQQIPTPYVPEGNISGKVLVVLWPLPSLRLSPGEMLDQD